MPFITEQAGPLASIAAPLLARQLVLPMTVTRIARSDFQGPSGDTVNVRVPQPGAGEEQNPGGGALTPEEIVEVSVAVQVRLQQFLTNLDEYHLNLEVEDFARQVTAIQVEAVARRAEAKVAAAMNALAADIEFAASATADDTKATVIAAREALSEADAPPGNRYLACSPSIISRLLSVPDFVRNDASGATTALRQADVGSIFGMRVIESNSLDTDEAVAYHQSGFVYTTFPPSNPSGATSSSVATHQGIATRVLFQYNPGTAQEQALVSAFAGAAAVTDGPSNSTTPRFVKLGVGTS